MPVDAPVTQADEVVEQQPQGTPDGGEAAGGTPAPTQEDYFLDVDERHRYKTRDDAARSIQESGRRIGELTPWQEHAQRYGVRDPNQLPQVFDDYLKMRERLSQLEAQVAGNQRGQEPAPQTLSTQDKTNVEYLERHGFSRKEALDKVLQDRLSPLEQQVNALTQQLGQSEEMQRNAAIDSGRDHLAGLMSKAGYPVDNPEFNSVVEDAISSWLEANSRFDAKGNPQPGSPLHTFFAGGVAARELVAEGWKRFANAANVMRQNADGQYQRQKEANVNRTPRPMPRHGAPTPTDNAPATPAKRTPGAGGIFTDPALHDKAWELMQEHAGRR